MNKEEYEKKKLFWEKIAERQGWDDDKLERKLEELEAQLDEPFDDEEERPPISMPKHTKFQEPSTMYSIRLPANVIKRLRNNRQKREELKRFILDKLFQEEEDEEFKEQLGELKPLD